MNPPTAESALSLPAPTKRPASVDSPSQLSHPASEKDLPIEPVSETRLPSEDEAPDGGLEAWLVAVGACCIFFCTLGFTNSFGVFQEYYSSHQLHDKSKDDVAWIGSLSTFLQMAAGSAGGPLFDRYGAWVCFFHPASRYRSSNNVLGNPPIRCHLCVFHHDVEHVSPLLAFHACAGCARGPEYWTFDVLFHDRRLAVLR